MNLYVVILSIICLGLHPVKSFCGGKGFGKTPNNNAFVSFDRFRSSCPEDVNSIRKFDPSLVKEDTTNEDVWVTVFRSNNNLPNVFVRDAFFDAMKTSTTVQKGDSETILSASTSATTGVVVSKGAAKPVAVARLTKSSDLKDVYIIDSMRCTLKKEDVNSDCDGGSEHTEAIGVCIDELVLNFLQKCVSDRNVEFEGGIRFRGTLVSGKLLKDRGFREVNTLSSDMHSHESDYMESLMKYAERSTTTAKNPGCRERALKIVSHLGRLDRFHELSSSTNQDDKKEDDFDPWASVKKYI